MDAGAEVTCDTCLGKEASAQHVMVGCTPLQPAPRPPASGSAPSGCWALLGGLFCRMGDLGQEEAPGPAGHTSLLPCLGGILSRQLANLQFSETPVWGLAPGPWTTQASVPSLPLLPEPHWAGSILATPSDSEEARFIVLAVPLSLVRGSEACN